MQTLHERLKELRQEKDLYQADMAKQLGVKQPTIAGWESGDHTPSLDMLITLAKFFNCTLGYLVGIED